MKDLSYDFEIPLFDSKIKFYFSLLFISIDDFSILVNEYGEDINIFNIDNQDGYYNAKSLKLNSIFENIKKNNEKIELNDKTIMKLFKEEEIINYYDSYITFNNDFTISDPICLERFYIYMLLEKVREKKQLEYGTIYDLFDTFLDEEILNAVANLDFEDKRTFIELFGLKGDMIFEINSNNHIKNDILIKLYSYMLLKRDEADIPSIIRNIIEKGAYEYNFYDYIRLLCKDKSLSNEFIFEMLSKMDYNSKQCIKEVFGEKLDKKRKPPKEKTFKKVVDTLSVIVKINKEYRKKQEQNKSSKKKAGFEEKKDTKETKKQQFEKENKNDKKEDLKEKEKENKEKKENKKVSNEKKENKKINKEKKEEKNKKDNKKTRLNNFLNENNLEKKDFEKAVELLDNISKRVVELYYGIKTAPLELEEISQIMGKPLEDILVILEKSEKKIIDLIKTGEINKNKKEVKKEEKEVKKTKYDASFRLQNLINSKSISLASLSTAMIVLDPIEKTVVEAVLTSKDNSLNEVSKSLNIKEEKAKEIYENASDKIISLLNINDKEIEKEKLKPEKKENKKVLENSKDKKEKKSSLSEFLKETGLSKSEFFKGFYKLDVFSKNVLSMYLGIYGVSMSIEEIAKKYGRNALEIENIISNSKNIIINENKKIDKINLKEILSKNKVTMDDFKNEFKTISILNKNLLRDYFGIGTAALSMDELARKYGKSQKEINDMVNSILSNMISKKTNKKDSALSDKLNKFLTINNITKEQFMKALELISPEDKMMLSMYFGIKGSEMNISQIAVITKINPILVKNNLENALKQINSLSKNKDLGKNVMDKKYQEVKFRIARISNLLSQDINFMSLMGINPNISKLLSIVNMNLSLEQTAKSLGISEEMLINELMSLEVMCDDFINNASKKNSNGFQDEELIKSKEVGRKY